MLPIAAGSSSAGRCPRSWRAGSERATWSPSASRSSAAALFLLSGAETDTRLLARRRVARACSGFGMGATMAPATESIMSSVPLRPRGRRLGDERHGPDGRRHARRGDPRKPPVEQLRCRHGARGEVAAGFRPPPRRPTPSATPSVVADQVGGSAGAALSNAAETAFTTAMSSTLTVAAATALAGAVARAGRAARTEPRAGREARLRGDAAGAGAREHRTSEAGRPGRRRGGAGPRPWTAAQRGGRPGDPRRDAENARRARGRGHDHRGRGRGRGRRQDDDLPALADQDRPDTGRHLQHRPPGRPAGHRHDGGGHGGPRRDAAAAALRLGPVRHRPARAGRVDERPGAAPGLRREGGRAVPRHAPVVHRAGHRSRRAAPRSRGGAARGPPARHTDLPDPDVARRPGLARAGARTPTCRSSAPGILNSSSEAPESARPRSSGSSRARRARSG